MAPVGPGGSSAADRAYTDIQVGAVVTLAPTPTGSNQYTALQAAWDAGDVLHLRRGDYYTSTALKPNAPGKRIEGMGKYLTTLQKSADTILLDISGASTAARMRHSSVSDLGLHGGSNTGWNAPLLRAYYGDNLTFRDVYFKQNYGNAARAVELWDSLFDFCVFEDCGGTNGARPAVHILRNDATVGNYGYSTDTCNVLRFRGCRWETFRDGGLWVEQGTGNTGESNNIYIEDGCKFETTKYRGYSLYMKGVRAVRLRDAYFSVSAFDSGFSTPTDMIEFVGLFDSTIDSVFIAQGAGSFIRHPITFNGGNTINAIDNIRLFDSGTITGNMVNFAYGGNTVQVGRNIVGPATPFGSTYPNQPWHRQGAGTPEGVIYGVVGSTWMRTDGGAATSFYVKESAPTLNTGWVAK